MRGRARARAPRRRFPLGASLHDLARELAVVDTLGTRLFLAHKAKPRVNEYIRQHPGVAKERMPMNIDRFGNTSAGTLPILIDECTRKGMLKKGELNMLLALGAGIHWGCALVRW